MRCCSASARRSKKRTPSLRRAYTGSQPSLGEETLALHLRALQLPAPVRQYKFAEHLGRGFAFDFCWPDRLLAVEVDGAVHRIKGRFAADVERHNVAALLGWQVLRFTPRDVQSGRAVEVLEAALAGNQAAALAAAQRSRRAGR